MDLAAIGAASIDMKMSQTQQAVGVAVTKKVLDTQEAQAVQLIKQMQSAVPSFGHKLDTYA